VRAAREPEGEQRDASVADELEAAENLGEVGRKRIDARKRSWEGGSKAGL